MSNNQNIDIDRYSAIFKALSSPSRLSIFLRLINCCKPGTTCDIDAGMGTCIGELGKDLGIVPSTVSHHIKELRQAGLINTQRRGQMIECWVDPEILHAITEFFLEADQRSAGNPPVSDK
ncbi:MAG: helix-turn-helix transcriptional regulator [Actinobacteria bacterium]|nr:helix-turn-helix transcriptional regulator [Actinomycetota bacterium]